MPFGAARISLVIALATSLFGPISPALSDPYPYVGSVSATRGRVVIIDPGHGGTDSGATAELAAGAKLMEKDANLAIAQEAADLLREQGFTVLLTRPGDRRANHLQRDLNGDGDVDTSDDLQARLDLANEMRADILVSIHNNSSADPSVRGTEVIYNESRPFAADSRRLAEAIHDELLRGLRDKGYEPVDKGVTTDVALLGYPLFVLSPKSEWVARPGEMPAALGENLFISNPIERELLARPEILERLGRAYADAVQRYYR